MEKRRRLPRQAANWRGRYTIEGGPIGIWGTCDVLDISIIGVGLELFEAHRLLPAIRQELIGRSVVVEVETPPGASVTLQVVGEIRNVGEGEQGGTRVGVAFNNLSEAEQAILNVLEHMKALW